MATTEQTAPPMNIEAEQHLLGACLLHHAAFAEAARFVGLKDFALVPHRRVWSALEHQQEQAGAPDWVTLPEALRATGTATEEEVDDLWRRAGEWRAGCDSYTKAAHWAKVVEDLGVRRRLIGVAGAIAEAGYDEAEAADAVRRAYQALGDATERRFRTGEVTLADTANALYERLTAGETGLGLMTRLPRLDAAMKGLRPGELTVLAARTAHGKTAMALQVARRVAGTGAPVAILSLEMDADALTERIVSAEAGLNVRDVLDGGGPDDGLERVVAAIGPLSELPITFATAPATTVPEVKQVVSRWADAGLCSLLIVDYLQLVGLGRPTGNRAYEVGAVAQALRNLAQEHRIHVLALAQLNRAVEHRNDPTPVLADLRESGGVEQAADAVLLLWRPYLFTHDASDDGLAHVHLAKNRAGPLAHEPLTFDAPTTTFRPLDEYHAPDRT